MLAKQSSEISDEVERVLARIGAGGELSALDLERIIPVPIAARLMGFSADTLKRRCPQIIRQLSPRRRGVKLRDAIGR